MDDEPRTIETWESRRANASYFTPSVRTGAMSAALRCIQMALDLRNNGVVCACAMLKGTDPATARADPSVGWTIRPRDASWPIPLVGK